MGNVSAAGGPPPASSAQVRQAIEELTDEEMFKLRAFARKRMWGGALGRWTEPEELIHDVIVSALEPDKGRTWCPDKVDFLGFMFGAIQSISSRAAARHSKVVAHLGNRAPADNVDSATVEDCESLETAVVERATARSLLQCLEAALEGDEAALGVAQCIAEDLKPREAREVLGLTDKDYDAARKRFERAATKLVVSTK